MLRSVTLRKTFKWFLVLLLLAAVGAGGFAYWMWTRTDELVHAAIMKKVREACPEWDFGLERAHFDWDRRVILYGVTIKAKTQDRDVFRIPEIEVTIDNAKFKESQQVDVLSMRLIKPYAEIIRHADRKWNWEQLVTEKRSDNSLPEIVIEQGEADVIVESPDAPGAYRVSLHKVDARVIPAGKRIFRYSGTGEVDEAGAAEVSGNIDLNAQQWTAKGKMQNLAGSNQLLKMAAGVFPTAKRNFVKWNALLERTRVALTETTTRTASREPNIIQPAPPAMRDLDDFDFQSTGTLDVAFDVERNGPDLPLDYRMLVNVRQGQVTHPVLPFPLRELAGEVYWDTRQVVLKNISAKNGEMNVVLNGKFQREAERMPGQLFVGLSNLLIDRRLRERLPPNWKRQYDTLQPNGPVDLQVLLDYDGAQQWRSSRLRVIAKGCAAEPVMFPYPVSRLTGEITQQPNDDLVVDLKGMAGVRPVTINGWLRNPGPEVETRFDIKVDRLPIDENFMEASLPAVRKTLDSLRLSGWADIDLALYRPPGSNSRFETSITADVIAGELEPRCFPYRIKEIRGRVTYSSVTGKWEFLEFNGVHDTAEISLAGTFTKDKEPGLLTISLIANNGRLDDHLRLALPESLQSFWANLAPSGRVSAQTTITWVPGSSPQVSIPQAIVKDGQITVKAFAFPLNEVAAKLSYADSKVTIAEFSGKQGETTVRLKGDATLPQGEDTVWRLRFEELYVDDLVPDRDFRKTLPVGLRSVVETMNPKKKLSLSGGVALAGTSDPRDPTTAAWDLIVVLSGNSLTAGVDLDNVHGRVSVKGTWNGESVDLTGKVSLDSAEVMGYQFTKVRGPFDLKGDLLTVGAKDVVTPRSRRTEREVAFEERLTANIIGGTVTVDAIAKLSDTPTWTSRITMINGDLKEYAKRYMPGVTNLAGVVNGWTNLNGRGSGTAQLTGNGEVSINPAALYELPVMARIFQVLSFTPADRRAFKTAFVRYDIGNSQFMFKLIDLVGDSLSLRGTGTVRFDGRLNLDFYSNLTQNTLVRLNIPLVSNILDQATRGWVRVEVGGHLSRPDARVKAVPVVDEALQGFLEAFGARPRQGERSRLSLPRLRNLLP